LNNIRTCRYCQKQHDIETTRKKYGRASGTALGNYCSEECYWEWMKMMLAKEISDVPDKNGSQ
jgi:hypothetical protein